MWGKHCCVVATGVEEVQWHSQVTWAQHGHSMGTLSVCIANMHLLGDLGHAPAMKNFKPTHSEIAFKAVFSNKYHSSDLPVRSLHVRMKFAIAHANN